MFGSFANVSPPSSLYAATPSRTGDPADLVSATFKPLFSALKTLNKNIFTLFVPAYIQGVVNEQYNSMKVIVPVDKLFAVFKPYFNLNLLIGLTEKELGFKNPFGEVLQDGTGDFLVLNVKIMPEAVEEFKSKLALDEAFSGAPVFMEFLPNTYSPFGTVLTPGISLRVIHLHKP